MQIRIPSPLIHIWWISMKQAHSTAQSCKKQFMNGRDGSRHTISFHRNKSNVLTHSICDYSGKKNIKRNIKDAGEKKMQVGEGRRKHKDPSSSMITCYGFHFKPTHFPFQLSRMEATFIFLLSYPSLLELVCPKTIKTLILIQSVANYMLHYGSF